MLRLERECPVCVVALTAPARRTVPKAASRVELDARPSRENFQNAARARLAEASRQDHVRGAVAIDDEIVIVPVADLELPIVVANALSNAARRREVEWRPRDRP
jgi:hypothetical protein